MENILSRAMRQAYLFLLYIRIARETLVDLAAKHALGMPVNKSLVVAYSDFKVLTNMYTIKLWQTEWEKISRE